MENTKTNDDIFSQAKHLLDTLYKLDSAYYSGSPIASDDDYDQLVEQLKTLTEKDKNIEKLVLDSGMPLAAWLPEHRNCKHRHTEFIPSLDKVNVSDKKLDTVLKRFIAGTGDNAFIIQPKLDGLSVVMYYDHGNVKFVTRGGGVAGEDVTFTMLQTAGVQRLIENCSEYHKIVIRGEVLYCQNKYSATGSCTAAELRSLAAGALRSHNPTEQQINQLRFIPFEILGKLGSHLNNYSQVVILSELLGSPAIDINWHTLICDNANELTEHVEKFIDKLTLDNRMLQLPDGCYVPVDGIVVKPASMKSTAKTVKNNGHRSDQLAVKFKPLNTVAVIKTINLNQAASGKLTPVAVFTEPVNIAGKSISKATLGSWSKMIDTGATPGATVNVELANEVIPKISKVIVPGETMEQPANTVMQGAHLFTKELHVQLHGRLHDLKSACESLGKKLNITKLLELAAQHDCDTLSDLARWVNSHQDELLTLTTEPQCKAATQLVDMMNHITPAQFIMFLKIPGLTKRQVLNAGIDWKHVIELYDASAADSSELSHPLLQQFIPDDYVKAQGEYRLRAADDSAMLELCKA